MAAKDAGTMPEPAPASAEGTGAAEPVEEWPPREWREATRSAGHKQAAYVTLAMLAMFGAIVGVAIWAAHNG